MIHYTKTWHKSCKYILFFCCFLSVAQTNSLDPKIIEKITNSIFIIEGRTNTKYLYEIKSVKYKNNKEAREICVRTVRNNYVRWVKSGQTNKYFEFLGNRFCPVPGDKTDLNKNWVNNLRKVSGLDL